MPQAYLITFTCYGTWLHGDARQSADRAHNAPGTPYLAPAQSRFEANRRRMTQRPYALDARRRACVLEALAEACARRGWALRAAHVQDRHLHAVVTAPDGPERVMNALKAYASRRLNENGFDAPDRKRWTRHGSTRYLWTPEAVAAAVEYVVSGQGGTMAVYDGRAAGGPAR